MRVLIDTHILIWHLEGNEALPAHRRTIIADPNNTPLISIASIWEIAIKVSLKKITLITPLEEMVRLIQDSNGSILSIETAHALKVSELDFFHKDPFDRMIIAQALVENVPLITSDTEFAHYGVELL
jgi:PIN domain nuclease of toxin-antitoxin system